MTRKPHNPGHGATGPSRPPRPGRDARRGRLDHGAPAHRSESVSPRSRPASAPDAALIWGTHAVVEALRSPRRTVLRLLATAAAAERVAQYAAARGLAPDIVSGEAIGLRVPKEAVHQGLLLEARPLGAVDLGDLPDAGLVILLDQVTDPHNVGAILRTAAAFGVSGLVMTERHAPALTGTLAKAASGGLEHVPVALVVNLARALDDLGRRGFQRIGLDSAGTTTLDAVAPTDRTALVLGAEGQGLRRLTRERCDMVARLDMPGAIKSLNVSSACAVALTTLRLRGTG